jgi:hypothetical protein
MQGWPLLSAKPEAQDFPNNTPEQATTQENACLSGCLVRATPNRPRASTWGYCELHPASRQHGCRASHSGTAGLDPELLAHK